MKPPEAKKLIASTRMAYGRRDRGDEHAGDSRPCERRGRAADLELRVAVHELFPGDERRQVRLVRDVEEHGQRADGEADDVELPDRQRVKGVEERDRRERQPAADVRDDEDRAAPQAVDPDARRQREEQERQELGHSDGRHLERAGIEDEDRGERDRELRDLRSDQADRLGGPELQEVRVPPEPAVRPEATHAARRRRRPACRSWAPAPRLAALRARPGWRRATGQARTAPAGS